MKRYEKVAVTLMALGFTLAMYLALRSDAGTIAEAALWPWASVSAILQLTAMGIAKKGWEKDTGKKAVLFFDLGIKKDPTE